MRMVNLSSLVWSSDWNGYELGFENVGTVGLYTYYPDVGPEINLYIDLVTSEILDMWCVCDCDEP